MRFGSRAMLNHYLELSDGQRRELHDLVDQVPVQSFLSRLHIDICEEIARLKIFSTIEHKVYTNLLIAHSDYCKNVTAALTLIRSAAISAAKITTALPPEFIAKVIGEKGCQISQDYVPSMQFLHHNLRFRLLLKTLAHRIYRLWPRKPRRTRMAIRTWVEISEIMFREEFPDSAILIYPFYLNIGRHLRYIRHCLTKYSNANLAGLPYRFGKAFRAVFFGMDIDIVKAEITAFSAHADEICVIASDVLGSSDEFEAGAICLSEGLQKKGRLVINKAHGLGYVCPYVGYDRFQVYNKAQQLYFGYKSPKTKFVVLPRSNSAKTEICQKPSTFTPSVVLLHGNYVVSGNLYEKSLEETICRCLGEFSVETGITTVIKRHPNAPHEEMNLYRKNYGLTIIKSLRELPASNPVFVTIMTAAFYDFYGEGPFLFVNEGIVPVKAVYGIDMLSTPVAGLKHRLTELCAINRWQSEHLNQIKAMSS